MESIRNFLKSRLGIVLLVLCLSPLAILGLESYFRNGADANEVAKVGDKSINRLEYQSAITNQRSSLINNGVSPSTINNQALNDQVLQNLIDRALLNNQTQNLGMYVSDKVVNDLLVKDPRFADAQGKFSNDMFAMTLRREGLTKSQMFDQYREQLNLSQLYDGITQTALYANEDINQLITVQEETRNAWLYRLPWQRYADGVTVTDEEVKTYYDTHKQELNSLAMVDLSYVVLDPNTLEIDPVTEDDVKAQYATYRSGLENNFRQQISQILVTGENALDTMAQIQKRLAEGDTFEALAKEFSEDPVSRDKGGDIGAFNATVFGEDAIKVEEALQGLDVGDVSEPIETSFGYQIFKVTDMEGEAAATLDSMREQLKEKAEQQKRETLFADTVMRINEMATDGLSIEDIAAQEEAVSLKKIENYTEVDNQSILNQPAVIEAAFDDFAIQDESVSTNIPVKDVTVWIQPTNYRPIKPLTLEQASDDIRQQLKKDKAIELATKDAEAIATEVNSKGIDGVDIEFMVLGEINRQYPMLSREEKAIAFSQDTQSDDLTAMAEKTDKGASVLVVDAVKRASIDNVAPSDIAQTAEILRQGRGQEHLKDYLNYLETATKVDKNETLIKDIAGL